MIFCDQYKTYNAPLLLRAMMIDHSKGFPYVLCLLHYPGTTRGKIHEWKLNGAPAEHIHNVGEK